MIITAFTTIVGFAAGYWVARLIVEHLKAHAAAKAFVMDIARKGAKK